jgi:cobalt-zinc-cadmium resistance protein CzcA
MAGLPGLEQTRSLSRYGLSQVTVIFKDGTDIYFARQLVNERIQEARGSCLPASPGDGADLHRPGRDLPVDRGGAAEGARKPDGSAVHADRPARDPGLDHQAAAAQRARRDRGQFDRRLREGVPGGARPERLARVLRAERCRRGGALERNNANVGAGYIEKRGEQYLVRAPGQVRNAGGPPQRRSSATRRACRSACATWPRSASGANCAPAPPPRTAGGGAGHGVHADRREQPHRLAGGRPEDGDQPHAAAGVQAVTVYDRTVLVDKAIATVKKNLLEGAVLVIAVLFLFLGNIRAALITALVIPLSMLFTFTGMVASASAPT